jgi:UDP-glucuronate 4-epimerase
MNILVTGSAGFIGFNVSRALLERGGHVIGIDNFNDYYDSSLKEARNKILERYANYKLYRTDIREQDDLLNIFSQNKIDSICHIAAQASVRYSLKHPQEYAEVNVKGTINVLEAARQTGVKNVVYASTSAVYGTNPVPWSENQNIDNQISVYGASKKACELTAHVYHHLYGINMTGLRFFTVYGPWGRPDMALFLFTKAILAGEPIDVYNYGKMKRDFTYIDDIVAGVLAALDKPKPYEIYNLGNSHPEELSRFIDVIEKNLNKKTRRNLLPIQPGDIPQTFADIAKARRDLGFAPKTGIEQGITKFITWYKEYYKIG